MYLLNLVSSYIKTLYDFVHPKRFSKSEELSQGYGTIYTSNLINIRPIVTILLVGEAKEEYRKDLYIN